MRRVMIATAVFAAMVCGTSVAQADKVGLFTDATINDLKIANGKLVLVFTGNNKNIEKPLDEIKSIDVAACPDFGKGVEKLFANDAAAAIKLFDASVAKMTGKWQKPLLRYYRIKAAVQAGQIGKATEDWASLVGDMKYDKALLESLPTTVGVKGSEDNSKAIAALLAVESKSATNADFVRKVREQLISFYSAEENAAKVKEYQGKLGSAPADTGGKTGDTSTGGGSNTGAAPVQIPGGSGSIAQVYNSYNAKKFDEVIAYTKKSLRGFGSTDLPSALFYLGKAQMEKFKLDGEKDRTLVQEAGLNFMRVYTFYPTHAQAGEALYEAALANKVLGNKASARQALLRLVDAYKDNQAQKALVEKANKALGELN